MQIGYDAMVRIMINNVRRENLLNTGSFDFSLNQKITESII